MEGGHHTQELLWKAFNIALFLGVLYWFGGRHIKEAFRNFFVSLTEGLDRSEEELRKAQEELSKAKQEYEDAKRRYQEQIKLAQETAVYIKEQEMKKAEDMIRRVREKASESIELELKRAKEELVSYGAKRVKELATALLLKEFEKEEVHRNYIEKKIKILEAKE